jgi:hypothetical protein
MITNVATSQNWKKKNIDSLELFNFFSFLIVIVVSLLNNNNNEML